MSRKDKKNASKHRSSPLTASADSASNSFSRSKLISLGAMVLIAILGIMLATQPTFAHTDEQHDSVIRPEIKLEQELDKDNLFKEPLVLMTASVINTGDNVAEITAWQYLIFMNQDTQDNTTCREAYVEYSDPENPLHFLLDAWKDIDRQMHIQLESSQRDLYYYNNNRQEDIRFYPKQADYGRWMCLRVANGEGDIYRALKIRTLEDLSPQAVITETPKDLPPTTQQPPKQPERYTAGRDTGASRASQYTGEPGGDNTGKDAGQSSRKPTTK